MSKIYSLEDAKKLISDFVEEEYGNEKVDFSDLSSIDVAYTTTDDELYDVQTKINLENFSINYFLDGNIIKTEGYGSLQELCVLALSCLSFDWLIEPAIDYWYVIMIESHSEQKIVECCIDLMQELVNEFEKYIDYIDIDLTELPDDEHFKVCYTNAEIVNRLLLSTTTHSGGTSTRQKCKELGLDSSKSIEFSFSTEE